MLKFILHPDAYKVWISASVSCFLWQDIWLWLPDGAKGAKQFLCTAALLLFLLVGMYPAIALWKIPAPAITKALLELYKGFLWSNWYKLIKWQFLIKAVTRIYSVESHGKLSPVSTWPVKFCWHPTMNLLKLHLLRPIKMSVCFLI